ncbi:MAG: sn-glycerol-1-phosphate dehydrogenase [Armatimonadota bacterium]|nr:sn-glycerol-1-phosphate dehydrogenase [Armatimonadota bacterium]
MPPVVYVGSDAVEHLLRFCESRRFPRYTLVADHNTYAAMGARIADVWAHRAWTTDVALLNGGEVIADEHRIMQLLMRADHANRVYLAVGSGTITDIVRFVSFVTRDQFISVPTAPSVDGYTSTGAALTIGKSKHTVPAHAPLAVFADLDTLCAAPPAMIAAGYGDMLGKYTSLADWELGHVVWGEAYSEPIARRVRTALETCRESLRQGAPFSREAIRGLTASLIESGQCIADFGSSEAASGSEHHLSHYWEMLLLRENRPPLLHGAKVAVGAVVVAGIYDRLRRLTRTQVATRLRDAAPPARDEEIAAIRRGFGDDAERIIARHSTFLDMMPSDVDRLKHTITDVWARIQDIASTVPAPGALAEMLRRVHAPVTPDELGLDRRDLSRALTYASYMRNRFTVLKLARWLGVPTDALIAH